MTHGKVTVNKFESCDSKIDYPIKIDFKLKDSNGMQILEEGSLKTKVPLGNDIIVNTSPNLETQKSLKQFLGHC